MSASPPPAAGAATNTDRELNIAHARLDGIASLVGSLHCGYASDMESKKDDIREHVSKIRSSLERLADCMPPVEITIPCCDEHDWRTDKDGNTYCENCNVCQKDGQPEDVGEHA